MRRLAPSYRPAHRTLDAEITKHGTRQLVMKMPAAMQPENPIAIMCRQMFSEAVAKIGLQFDIVVRLPLL